MDNSDIKEDTRLLGNPDKMPSKGDLQQLEPEEGGKSKKCCNLDDYPKPVFLILLTEFCERFSFYGMRTVLILFLKRWLLFDAHTATEIFHGFNMLCYFTPLIGAAIADGYLGKFRTIFYLSIVYAMGNLVMTGTSAITPPNSIGPLIGLFLIGFGTGGIKPCVAAFGGDQFREDQTKQLSTYFSIFYFAINAGSLISTFLTPVLREDVPCGSMGKGNCYPLSFGVPALLMIVAIICFVSGKKYYKINPPTGNVLGKFFMCIFRGIANSCKSRKNDEVKREKWIDHADDVYERDFINDVWAVFKVLVLFIPLPVFWALYDQQGSTWTLQAEKMDGDLGFFIIKPDQIQAINTVLIILFIPLFESLLFPLMEKCNINRPLLKMCAGMVLAASAFVMAGFVQISIDAQQLPALSSEQARVRFTNVVPCPVNVYSTFDNHTNIPAFNTTGYYIVNKGVNDKVELTTSCPALDSEIDEVDLNLNETTVLMAKTKTGYVVRNYADDLTKPMASNESVANVRFIFLYDENPQENRMIKVGNVVYHNVTFLGATPYKPIVAKLQTIEVSDIDENGNITMTTLYHKPRFEMGGVYTVVLLPNTTYHDEVLSFEDVKPNTISMLLQIPQYVLITMGEILFSVTGLSFAYSEAPASMKSVVQSFWLLTTGFGNLIVIIAASVRISENDAVQFFVFAVLMGVDIVIFSILSCLYKPHKVAEAESKKEDTADLVVQRNESFDNLAYDEKAADKGDVEMSQL